MPQIDRKKQRHRSPAYPSVDLPTAIEKAEAIYREEKRSRVPVSVAVQHFGYDSEGSSSGMRLVAALKQYGLLVEEGNNEDRLVRLSELALDILLADSESSSERLRAIKEAALSPTIHSKIWEHYHGQLPSKAALRAFLIRQMDFNDAHVDRFIGRFLNTVDYARLEEPDKITDESAVSVDDEDDDEDDRRPSAPDPQSGKNIVTAGAPVENVVRLPITLPTLKVAWLEVPFPMADREFDSMISLLNVLKDALVKPPGVVDKSDQGA